MWKGGIKTTILCRSKPQKTTNLKKKFQLFLTTVLQSYI